MKKKEYLTPNCQVTFYNVKDIITFSVDTDGTDIVISFEDNFLN